MSFTRSIFVISICIIFASVESNVIVQQNGEEIKPVPAEAAVAEATVESVPAEVATQHVASTNADDCVPIGQFCTYHSQCCSNACLGYMKRCVTGSG